MKVLFIYFYPSNNSFIDDIKNEFTKGLDDIKEFIIVIKNATIFFNIRV